MRDWCAFCRPDTDTLQGTKAGKGRQRPYTSCLPLFLFEANWLERQKWRCPWQASRLQASTLLLLNGRQVRLRGRRCPDSFHLGTLWTRKRSRAQAPVLCVSLGMPKEWYLCLGRAQGSAFWCVSFVTTLYTIALTPQTIFPLCLGSLTRPRLTPNHT